MKASQKIKEQLRELYKEAIKARKENVRINDSYDEYLELNALCVKLSNVLHEVRE